MSQYIYNRLYIDELNQYADAFSDCYPLFSNVNQQFTNSEINYVGDKINIITENQLTAEEENTLDSIVNEVNNNAYANILEEFKENKIDEIRNENQQLLFEKGAEFPPGSGVRFAMRDTDMSIWNGMILAANSFTYPITVRDVNNIPHSFNSPSEIQQFWGTGLAYVQSVFDSTVEKITEVKNLTTITDVLNWTDDRLE